MSYVRDAEYLASKEDKLIPICGSEGVTKLKFNSQIFITVSRSICVRYENVVHNYKPNH
jgi:hypothetical protein